MAEKRRDPEVVFLEIAREVVFRRATAIRLETGPTALTVSFVVDGKQESFPTLGLETGNALLAHLQELSGGGKRMQTRLPEGTLSFEIGREGAITVLLREPERPNAPDVGESPVPDLLTMEPVPEEEVQLGIGFVEEDSVIVPLANELLIHLHGSGSSGFRIDLAAVPALSWDGGAGTPPEIAGEQAALILRRILMMAGMAFTRKTEGAITLVAGRNERLSFRVTRQSAKSDLEPILVDRTALAAIAVEHTASRPFPGPRVGVVQSTVREIAGDHDWTAVESEIVLDASFASGLKGLDAFSHAIVVFWMERSSFEAPDLVRRPQGRDDVPPTGIFAHRATHRPNPIGVTVVRIEGVDAVKGSLKVQGLDAIDGTAVLDVKPYVPALDRPEHSRVPDWMDVLTQRRV